MWHRIWIGQLRTAAAEKGLSILHHVRPVRTSDGVLERGQCAVAARFAGPGDAGDRNRTALQPEAE